MYFACLKMYFILTLVVWLSINYEFLITFSQSFKSITPLLLIVRFSFILAVLQL